jgi:hypothetical protein
MKQGAGDDQEEMASKMSPGNAVGNNTNHELAFVRESPMH